MHKTVYTYTRAVLVIGLIALGAIQLSAQAIDTIFVSDKYSVHVAFPHELRYVDVSNDNPIQTEVLENYSNILSIKCREKFLSNCSMTVLLSSGTIETFILKYKEEDIDLLVDRRADSSINDVPSIDDIMDMDKKFTSIGTKRNGILVLCDVIRHHKGMVFLRLELTNESSSDFSFEQASFIVEKKLSYRKRSVESSFLPTRLNSVGTLSAKKGETSKMVLCFDEFHIRSGEWLVVYIHSKDREDLKFYITAKDFTYGTS